MNFIDLTTGNITRKLLWVSWPMIIDTALFGTVTFVDIAILGRLGSESIAALGFCRPMVWLMFALFGGYNQSINAIVARHIGAKEPAKAQDAAYHALLLTTYIGAVISILLIVLMPFILGLFSVEDSVRKLMHDYLIVVAFFVVFQFYTDVLTGVFQGMGHTRIRLYTTAFMNILNVMLSYYFILGDEFTDIIPIPGLGLGIKGAAWSLAISRVAASSVMFILLRYGNFPVKIQLSTFRLDWRYIRPINVIGLPIGVIGAAGSIMFIIVNEIAARSLIGTSAISALAVGQQTEWFAYMPMVGLMGGTAVMVGQNLGAQRFDRAETSVRIACWISFIYLSFWCLLYVFFAGTLVRIFTPDPAVAAPSMMYVFVFAVPVVTYFTLPIHGALRAAGDTTIPMIINLLAMFAVRIPLTWYLTLHTSLDYEGIWWGMAIGMMFENTLIYMRYKQNIWKRIKL